GVHFLTFSTGYLHLKTASKWNSNDIIWTYSRQMINASSKRSLRIFAFAVASSGCVGVLAHFLRQLGLSFNPVLWASAQIIVALLGFTIAANILVRFHGTVDRFSLFLGAAFGLDGLIQLTGMAGLHGELLSGPGTPRVPLYWMAGWTVL